MKLVLLLYLEEDEGCVEGFLRESGVDVFSRFSIEGVGPSAPEPEVGWYGAAMPFESRLAFAIVSTERARRLVEAVRTERAGLDARRHPVRAFEMPVDAVAVCGFGERQESD